MSSSVTRADVSSWQLREVTTNPISSSPWRHNTTVKRPDREGGCNTPHSGPYPSYLKKKNLPTLNCWSDFAGGCWNLVHNLVRNVSCPGGLDRAQLGEDFAKG